MLLRVVGSCCANGLKAVKRLATANNVKSCCEPIINFCTNPYNLGSRKAVEPGIPVVNDLTF